MKTFAAIDLGSFDLTMKIFEFPEKDKMKEVEQVRKRLDVGTDTYEDGRISPGKMDEICRALCEFTDIMKTYKVDDYKAYGTSAIRETLDTVIVLDQIAQRTGIHLEVLSNSEEQFLDYKSIASKGETFHKIIEEGTAILDIGGGSMQISLFDQDKLITTQNLKLGVLRIQEQLHQMDVGRSSTERLVDEMITSQLATFAKMHLKDRVIKNVIMVDDYLSPWIMKKVGGKSSATIGPVEEYEHVLDLLRTGSEAQAALSMDIPEEKVSLTYISAIILRRVSLMMNAETIWTPGVTLCDGIAYEYAEKNKLVTRTHDFDEDIIAFAVNISKRYMGSRKRAETLENIAITIFDSMKKVHGMGKREKLYLRLAALMHDCGKYISMVNVGVNSYNIIKATEIIGLSDREREIVANVVRYNHDDFSNYGKVKSSSSLMDRETYLTVAKLTAILRISNCLDRSHKQKMKGIKAQLKDDKLILKVDTLEDITLERAYFESGADLFREVFSIEPVLVQKKSI